MIFETQPYLKLLAEMKLIGITVLLMLLGMGSLSSRAQEGRFAVAGLSEDEVETFFMSFRQAIASNDKKKIASLVDYPIRVTLASGARRTIRNRAQLLKAYDQVFHAEFRELITKTELSDLWAKWSGVATPRGEIWFAGIESGNPNGSYTIKIIAINGSMPVSKAEIKKVRR